MVRPGHSPVFAPSWGASAASSATRSPALCEGYPGVVTLPSLYPPSMPRRRGRRLDQDAGDIGVLVDPVAGADAVVAVGDDERVAVVAAQEQDRGQGLAGGHLDQVGRDVLVRLVEQSQLAGAQDVLGLAVRDVALGRGQQ